MKKFYSLIVFCLFVTGISAIQIPVSITNSTFTPSSFSANVGDTVVWTLNQGVHTTTSVSVPSGAATWNSGVMSTPGQTFSYVITVAGTYGYQCTIHSGMVGGFTATSTTSVSSPGFSSLKPAYPNPFSSKVTIPVLPGTDEVSIINIIGEIVYSEKVRDNETRVELDLSGLAGGVYFYNIRKEGVTLGTRKLIRE